MSTNKSIQLQTIEWINQKINENNTKATSIGEMLLEETNPILIEILDNKLAEIEQEYDSLNHRLQIEERLLNASIS